MATDCDMHGLNAAKRTLACWLVEAMLRTIGSIQRDRSKIGGAAVSGYLRARSLTEGGCVAWMLRLMEIGVEGEEPCTDVNRCGRRTQGKLGIFKALLR